MQTITFFMKRDALLLARNIRQWLICKCITVIRFNTFYLEFVRESFSTKFLNDKLSLCLAAPTESGFFSSLIHEIKIFSLFLKKGAIVKIFVSFGRVSTFVKIILENLYYLSKTSVIPFCAALYTTFFFN